jgi:hypothetical protein
MLCLQVRYVVFVAIADFAAHKLSLPCLWAVLPRDMHAVKATKHSDDPMNAFVKGGNSSRIFPTGHYVDTYGGVPRREK